MKKSFFTMSSILLMLALLLGCQRENSQKIQFGVSQGVMNAMDFSPLGIQKGDPVDSLLLYTRSGDPLKMDFKKHEKAILLISGSYTCDITRGNMEDIQSLFREFGSTVDIYLVNTLEAHPDDSPSPYSAEPEVWLAASNLRDSISAPQPKTMGERIRLADQWIKESNIQIPVLLDGPENRFWNFAGQAPNMAVLVENGIVVLKQPWFDYERMCETLTE
ncbi:hypothetical protein J0A67_14085 [Algoriphagus aestuariicola]|uniref:Iodothyronine deiodinase n=1 Tax=Algoriphagus aestuariicola TaxID=1852016 RepID=A0ABS3BRU9_9BACT|nr:hypothetical protein [Algoriphagus aestuariicola]MBN7801999.1 hypothetical protein [Algoriphagus aestuariicola]